VNPWLILSVVVLIGAAYIVYRERSRTQEETYKILGLLRDMETLNQRLHTVQQQMAAFGDAAFDAMLMVDADRRIVMINKAGCDLFGVQDAPTSQTLMSVSRNHELDTLVANIQRGESSLESQIEIGDRAYRVRAADLPGRKEVVLVLQDISELLRLSRARRDMVANISHDLGTPISSIRLLVDTLLQNFGRNPDRDKKQLRRLAGATDSLEHMTRELIDLSMIESGKAIIRMVPINFRQIVAEAFDMMTTQAEQKKIEMVNEVPADLRVLADADQTKRVLTNVLHNAIKFTPQAGRITCLAAHDKQMATVTIQDTGPGIPPQDRKRIFERFYQVDSARSGKSGGSGLGLSIAKHIIEAQGGSIWAEAAVPGGACICFTLPLADSVKSPA
jgi:two-component system, OmpR family, phosphate regulon sensor histidine kinase PhoR